MPTIKTVIFLCTPVRMVWQISQQIASAGEDVEKGEPSALMVRMKTGAVIIENSMEFLRRGGCFDKILCTQ